MSHRLLWHWQTWTCVRNLKKHIAKELGGQITEWKWRACSVQLACGLCNSSCTSSQTNQNTEWNSNLRMLDHRILILIMQSNYCWFFFNLVDFILKVNCPIALEKASENLCSKQHWNYYPSFLLCTFTGTVAMTTSSALVSGLTIERWWFTDDPPSNYPDLGSVCNSQVITFLGLNPVTLKFYFTS